MRNRFFKVLMCFALLITVISFNGAKIFARADEAKTVYLGGFATGFSINTRGAEIVGICDVITDSGVLSPAKDAEILPHDKLLSVGDVQIDCSSDIEKALKGCKGEKVVVTVMRNGERLIKEVEPAIDLSGKYKLGLFIRDDLNGIGTMTFIKQNGEFMALGHPIVDDREQLCDVLGGNIYRCSIIGINKGVRGKAGELKGIFIKDDAIGEISGNFEQGIKGKLSSDYDFSKLTKIKVGEAKIGSAKMVTSINGVESLEYDISIVKADGGEKPCKNLVVKITDERLLKSAGGIVQGMSGSPIVQDGKLVGAVTHVFINDPTRGYGICINNMLNA
ncbi:MAG: PDZ domain-containing protein [Clostridia bacterium]|nr:PDZ domain-containing protein [Clostridia bacterium]